MKSILEKMRSYARKYPLLDWLGWLFLSVPLVVYAFIWFASCTTPSFLPVGLFMAFGAQLVAAGRYVDTQKQKREQFFLESFVDAYAEALGFLRASNNERADRVAWVAAGRAVAIANGLAAEITELEFRHVLEIHRLKCLRDFSDFLEKPAYFYYGAPINITNIEEAAEWSTRRETGRFNETKDTSIPLEAIRPIWAAVQWTKIFENECKKMRQHLKKRDDPAQPGEIPPSEPLKCQGFSGEEVFYVSLAYRELSLYISHKLNWGSVDGKLHRRESQN